MTETEMGIEEAEFAGRLHSRLNERRQMLGMSWRQVAREIDVPPSTFTRLNKGNPPGYKGLIKMMRWLHDDGKLEL